jgi:hypothetical protein
MAGGQVSGDLFDRGLRRRQPDPLQRPSAAARRVEAGLVGDVREPLERQREMGPAARADNRVDLVDDHRAHRAQHLPAAVRREEQIQRFRRRDQDVRRRAKHRGALRLCRIAGSHCRRDPRRPQSGRFGQTLDPRARLYQVPVNIGAERLQRRDIDDADFIRQRRRLTVFEQRVDGGEECGERFT